MTEDLSQIDRDALERAIQILRREPERAQQIDEMLKHQEWVKVAAFAAYHCQMASLRLPPQFINPPCWIVEDDSEEDDKTSKSCCAECSQLA